MVWCRPKKTAPRNDNLETSHSKLLGIVYETRIGIEIAVRVVDIKTTEILATADAYSESKKYSALETMAKEMSERFHRRLPLMSGSIIHIMGHSIIVRPEKWIPEKRKLRKDWPLFVYHEKNPGDMMRGTDTDMMICNAFIDTFTEIGNYGATIGNAQQCEIMLKDKVVNQ
ncbi:MAG: hypothetical protein GY795_13550 [Desulfobacterales bacterium]|nr:hypothetical protein [Desulfobacterales bacterium]